MLPRECRPWTRWWWFGSAEDEAELTRHLELFREAGFGGVEISPIYGVSGAEARAISYLSPRWLECLRHTLREAARLGLGVDLIQGTGWPFGGPMVRPEDAAARIELTVVPLEGSVAPAIDVARGALQALVAVGPDGQILDLTARVDASGKVSWRPPDGGWSLYAAQMRLTGQRVKRAAPGGEGLVLDPFSATALEQYLSHFAAVASLPPESGLRCLFNDSYEVYGANWTRDLFDQFQRRRGYDLRRHFPALMGLDSPERNRHVRADYRETVADLLLDQFARTWTGWAHRHGLQTRYQAHGSPGNLLDLYAAADIPETEMFGPPRGEAAGVALAPGAPACPAGWQEIMICKLASSAAHVAGKPLCSSESMTWLGEHFQVSLAAMKGQADALFVAGVNHLFFHGSPFSPAGAAWPGWLFYASTHVGPTNSWWRDLPALNAYLTRCQSFLQAGRPDNDLLVYFPIGDLWASEHGAIDLLQYLRVHNVDHWLEQNLPELAVAVRLLWQRGYGFDFVSDLLLDDAVQVHDSLLQSRGGAYPALLIAGSTRMPPSTLERILALAREGATVAVLGDLPRDVPGLGDRDARLQQLQQLLNDLGPRLPVASGVSEIAVGRGRLLFGADLEAILSHSGIRRESLVDHGLEFIRRSDGPGKVYFLANRSEERLDGWVKLAAKAWAVTLLDPMTGRGGAGAVRAGAAGETEVYLQLEPGASLLLANTAEALKVPGTWPYVEPAGPPHAIEGKWSVEFVEGGPALPQPARVSALTSWTTWAHDPEALAAFSGTARYRIAFDRPDLDAELWALELGQVASSARVTLNGQARGTLIAPPFRLLLTEDLRPTGNVLVIEVTNLMANRIAAMDQQGIPWKPFFFVNRQYQPFDASDWEPLPSGLLGSVRLIPLRRLEPD